MAAVNRPSPAQSGPNGGNIHTRPSSGITNSGQQDPGPPFHPQHHMSARPVFYIPAPAPPPPPFLHYQWPMPFSYNPFAGFPGMGYGMVMPPFPPPPYMESPAYIMPNPQIQPVDYRRFLHPHFHAPSAPYQNPNQTRRGHLPHAVPPRETVNSEVQTEPTQRGLDAFDEGSPHISSDCGLGTASISPSSSSSSSPKRGPTKAEDYTKPSSNSNDLHVNGTCTSSTVKVKFNIPRPTATKTVESCIRATLETLENSKDIVGQDNVPPCNMWSVSSPDNLVPACSSFHQEGEVEVVKERHASVPDILMSWGAEVEHEKSIYQSPVETKSGPVVADCADTNEGSLKDHETPSKILKLPFGLHELFSESRRENELVGLVSSVSQCLPDRDEPQDSLNESHKLPDNEQGNDNETNPHEDTTEIIPYKMSLNSSQRKRKMNESVWSVESLAPFIPTKEWLLQNSMFEPEVIIETTEEAENVNPELSTQNDSLFVESIKERRRTLRFSSSDSVPMSDSWLIFSTPAGKQSPAKKPETESENYASEMRGPNQGQSMAPSEKDPVASPIQLQREIISSNPTEEDVDKNRSSEPEAIQCPNQESLIVNEQEEKSPRSPEQQKTLSLNSAAGETFSSSVQLILQNRVDMEDRGSENKGESQLRNEQLCVPMAEQEMAEVSPSKGHIVDIGVQCTNLLDCVCGSLKSSMQPNRKQPFKYSDMKKANLDKAEGSGMNGHVQKNQKRHGPWRNR
ncbi:uncharacterized protein LOC123971993 isoform X2 [Micropterus dolomieu]|nr:uncharacterized protein LOC123971993 isoform X2 [Micropterus dolomieu]